MSHDSAGMSATASLAATQAEPEAGAKDLPARLEPPVSLAEDLVLEAKNSFTVRCGKSSITLYANGKIVLRGESILSDAEGINRIAGGQIQLN